MDQELHHLMNLMERHNSALRALATELQQSTQATAALKLDDITESSAREESLLHEIRFIQQEIREMGSKVHMPGAGSDLAGRMQALGDEERAACGLLRKRNRVRGAFLRRARRSVNVLMNFLARYSETYSPLVAPRWGEGARRM